MASTTSRRTSTLRARRQAQEAEGRGAVVLTADGRALLEQRLRALHEISIPRLVPLLVGPERDERDVAEFERLEAEALQLEGLLAEAVTAIPSGDGVVELGARVLVGLPDGDEQWVRPVHPAEASLDEERVSVTSPLSRALLGSAPGDAVTVEAPSGPWTCRVLGIRLDTPVPA